jgi:Ca-activated chloride channel family protein
MAWILRIAALAAVLACASAAYAQAPAPDVMLILDASNSMWGRVDGRPKIVVARAAVVDLLRALPRGTRLGLMAYGHRRAADCSDIETIVPVGPVDANAIAARVNAITPRGRTPLTEAVRQAARELHSTERPARVILVSDGIETCNADPCALAAELRASGVDFVTHVIGFDVVDARDQAQLRCLAERTGGQFLSANDARSLAAALATITATAPPPAAAAPPPPPRAAGPTNLTLEAVEVEGGRILESMLWTLETAEEQARSVIDNSGAARPELAVPAGRYRVTALSGNARIVESFDVAGARQTYRVVMNVGRLRLSAGLAAGQPPIGGLWTIEADEAPGFRTGDTVVETGDGTPELILTQGSYRVRFVADAATATADVNVTAAQTQSARLDLGAGRVSLAATRGGRPDDDGLWEVQRVAADGTREDVASSGAGRPDFVLPAGNYVARAFRDNQWFERPFAIAAGQSVAVTVARP